MSEEQVQTTAPEQQNQPVFSIEKLYVKDLSLEVPHAPQIFLEAETPEVDMRISTESKAVEEGFYDCNLTVTVTAKDLKMLLGIACPNILFPYAREAVSSTITRAGFPPVLLAPINFDAMYHQAQETPAAE